VYLKELTLLNFKNYPEAHLYFDSGIQCLLGKNGSGKTNLLEAIHYLSTTKNASGSPDQANIRHGENQFMIRGIFSSDTDQDVQCAVQSGQKKILTENGLPILQFSRHIGKYPVVLVTPNDIELIWDGSELRRKFLDNLIAQVHAEYLSQLIAYANLLKQRNGLIRMFSERGTFDPDALEAYDHKMIPVAEFIFSERKKFVARFLPIFIAHYEFLVARGGEDVQIQYRSELEGNDLRLLLKKNITRDIALARTTTGIHRDDLLFLLNGEPLRHFGSQGQQKSFLIALKLAEFQILSEVKQDKPLLLLDDIFDKLDNDRIHKLLLLVARGMFGQLFMTDARSAGSRNLMEVAGIKVTLFEVTDGRVKKN
jgi:DNA replication and repair protein RecF